MVPPGRAPGAAAFSIVPQGGQGQTPPNPKLIMAAVGIGGVGPQQFEHAAFAYFDMGSKPVTIEVQAPSKVASVVVRPLQLRPSRRRGRASTHSSARRDAPTGAGVVYQRTTAQPLTVPFQGRPT